MGSREVNIRGKRLIVLFQLFKTFVHQLFAFFVQIEQILQGLLRITAKEDTKSVIHTAFHSFDGVEHGS